uniref:RING-type domain-containing protein n=1 Tax=Anopheles dirus TaxID=7168 RepID=A0A182MYP5_9DIPT
MFTNRPFDPVVVNANSLKMANISIDNFLHTDRPLTWRPKPSCDRCLLPFTNESEDLVRRDPLLLACQHILCGQCVQEYASTDSIVCEHCKKSTPLVGNKEQADFNVSLHPSYYMLGIMERMQQELQNIHQYWEEQPDHDKRRPMEVEGAEQQSYIGVVIPSDINTPKKLKAALGKACHAYEKSKLTLDKRSKSFTDNIDQVVNKINAHFVSMHNALQLEEDRVLRQVRKSFLEHHQYKTRQEQRLQTSEKRLKELTAKAKRLTEGGLNGLRDQTWLKFVSEVKLFIENEPLKLFGTMEGRFPTTIKYTEFDRFTHMISKTYSLMLPDPYKTMQLVPVAYHCGFKKHTTPQSLDASGTVGDTNGLPVRPLDKVRTTSRVPVDFGMRQGQMLEQNLHASVGQTTEEKKRHNSYLNQPDTKERKQQLSFSMVKVTCIVDPHEFYVQDDVQYTERMAKALDKQCQAEANGYDAERNQLTVAPGMLYLVRPDGSESWYRAKMLNPLGGTRSDQPVRFMVQYVDYGRTEAVGYDQIRPISKELCEKCHGAIKCALYNVAPPQNALGGGNSEAKSTYWPKECGQVMNDFIAGQKMVMCKLSKASRAGDSGLLVDLFLPPIKTVSMQSARKVFKTDEFQWEGYYAPMSLRSMLLYLQQCHPVTKNERHAVDAHTVEQLNRWLQRATTQTQTLYHIPPSPVLREYDSFDVRITHSISPDHFFIMPEQWKVKEFDLLQQQLIGLCREMQSEKFFCPYVGLICAFTIDKENDDNRVWLRGRVRKVLTGACEMFALDTGEVLVAFWEDMRLLAAGSAPLSKHAFAINCRLDHIHPERPVDYRGGRDELWNSEALGEFRQISCSTTLRFAVRIGQRCVKDDIYDVVLYLRNKCDRDTCVNGLLVASGHAACDLGKEEEITDRSRILDGVLQEAVDDESAGKDVALAPREAKKVVDPRVPINVLKVVSPSEIYVRMCSRTAGLVQLHETLQQHMAKELEQLGDLAEYSHSWSTGDMCLVLTSTAEDQPSKWYRARIMSVCEQGLQYEAFLIDRAVTVKVPCTMVVRLTARFAQVQPGAIRCRLACIEPIGGSAKWHKSTLDDFKCMIQSYNKHAITLDGKGSKTTVDNEDTDTFQSLSVVLWGVRQSVPLPLTPQTTEYRNLNQLLVVRGLAHSSGRFRTFVKKGSGAVEELETLEQAITELQRAEYENMQQIIQHVIVDTPDAACEGRTGDDVLRTVVNGKETHAVMVDQTCAAALALADVSVEHINAWPKPLPIDKTVFVGMPTSLGNDGTVFLHDICQEPVLHRIRDTIADHVARMPAAVPQANKTFKPEDPCLARYHLDGSFYRATVLEVVGFDSYRVLFVDYGNEEICSGENDLLSDVVCVRVPVQVSRFRLKGIKPKQRCPATNQWPEDALDACHGLFVQKCCTVRVDTSMRALDGLPNNEDAPIPCGMTLLKDSVDVAAVLIDLGLFVSVVERKDARKNWTERKKFTYSFTEPDAYQDQDTNVLTAEQRELLRFIGQVADDKRNLQNESDVEDPNELPETTMDDYDWMNRPPLQTDAAFFNANDSGQREAELASAKVSKSQVKVMNRSLSSPVFFDWDGGRFDTSSRLSDEDDPNDLIACSAGEGILRSFTVLPPIDRKTVGFFAEYTSHGDGQTLHVYPHLEGHTNRMSRMAERIQFAARSRHDPQRWHARQLAPGAPCLAPYRVDGLYYRAIVEEVLEERNQIRVLYVDYMNRDTLPMSELRRCPSGIRHFSLRNIEVCLVGVRPSPRLRPDDVARRLIELLQRPFYVKIVHFPTHPASDSLSGNAVPEVELYTDVDCATLAYQKMIDEKYYYVTSS